MTHLWEMETHWFQKTKDEVINTTFSYKSWKEFLECKPYKLWKPYILSSWSWRRRVTDDIKPGYRHEPGMTLINSMAFLHSRSPSIDETKQHSELLQIVFLSPDRFTGVHRVEIAIERQHEEEVRDWLKRHMPSFWKV